MTSSFPVPGPAGDEADRFYRQSRKKWHRPRFYRYRVADPGRFEIVRNRYPHHVVGVALVLGRYCYAIKWASL